jgi:hypothetical protein
MVAVSDEKIADVVVELRAAISLAKRMGAAGSSRTNIHVLAERAADEIERLREGLNALVTDVENKWGDPHTLRAARSLIGGE